MATNTILLLQVSAYFVAVCSGRQRSNLPTATSGACATIASDAIMNPFDGKTGHGAFTLLGYL